MMNVLTRFAASDSCSSFLSFPTWYKYVHATGNCTEIQINNINDVWLIVAAIIEILLRIAGLLAVAFVMYGGFRYVTSRAEPDAVNKARQTIINALIGLAISILAAVTVNFIAGRVN